MVRTSHSHCMWRGDYLTGPTNTDSTSSFLSRYAQGSRSEYRCVDLNTRV
ncbi:uncharacterized protein HMPREF1541_09004 [Cyphellophora europaea CBS 101466]|uniref:Uncharacterized protein n=1 Tax=Cyphellophora europaea (strain CBS 101466) TaxID=1220924 RepID=W2RJS2_CYPE1|nr:uncharacterized protein HMPREF1541_09004 [Cyphellophora europaea CBS 101466]ETN36726.1 hypothetical protein HMPREF1541_09004 [Cyphellophora europaea CBS 101466]